MGSIRRAISSSFPGIDGRAILYQVALIGAVLATLYFVVRRVIDHWAEHGLRSGFGFLSERAGFHMDEWLLLPRLDPDLYWFVGSVGVGVLAAWGLTRWAARRRISAAADTRFAVLRMTLLFGIPAATLGIASPGFEAVHFTSESTFRQILVIGIVNTLQVSVVALVLSTIVGMVVALMRLSPNWLLRAIGRAYVELVCNIPLLLLLFFCLSVFYSVPPDRQSRSSGEVVFIDNRGVYLPDLDIAPGLAPLCIAVGSALFLTWLTGRLGRDHAERTGRKVPVLPIRLALLIGLPGTAVLLFGAPLTYTLPVLERFEVRNAVVLEPVFVALVVAMGAYYGAYAAEIIRTGIQGVLTGGGESAHSVRSPEDEGTRSVSVPLVFREIIAPMISRYLGLIKNSSLGVAVGYPEIVTVGNGISSATGQSIEILVLILAFYVCICLSVSICLAWYRARLRLKFPATETPAIHEPSPFLSPPAKGMGPLEWVHRNLLSPWWNAVLTIAAIWLCGQAMLGLYGWFVQDAAFVGGGEACQRVAGVCWPFLADNWAHFLVGVYPEGERWRAYSCLLLLLFVLARSPLATRGRYGVARFYAVWCVAPFVLVAMLHGGGWLGLRVVPVSEVGGLTLTILLSIIGIVAAFPLGVLLALGRQSRNMPALRLLCIAFIELIRAVPLIPLLFLAMVLVPLFLSHRIEMAILIPVQIGLILFHAAYLAEVVGGGLQTATENHEEPAGRPCGGRTMVFEVLPQALRTLMPAIPGHLVFILKNTSLVVLFGLLDLVATARLTLQNPEWFGLSLEAYAVTGLLYWIPCFMLSRSSLALKRRLQAQRG